MQCISLISFRMSEDYSCPYSHHLSLLAASTPNDPDNLLSAPHYRELLCIDLMETSVIENWLEGVKLCVESEEVKPFDYSKTLGDPTFYQMAIMHGRDEIALYILISARERKRRATLGSWHGWALLLLRGGRSLCPPPALRSHSLKVTNCQVRKFFKSLRIVAILPLTWRYNCWIPLGAPIRSPSAKATDSLMVAVGEGHRLTD